MKNKKHTNKLVDKHEPVQIKPLQVIVYDNFDRAFRAFRALVQKEKVISEYKQKQSFEKPSDKKRRKRKENQRKLLDQDKKYVKREK